MKVDELTNGETEGVGCYISWLSSRIVESSDTCRRSGGSARHIDDENATIIGMGERAPMNRPLFDPSAVSHFQCSDSRRI